MIRTSGILRFAILGCLVAPLSACATERVLTPFVQAGVAKPPLGVPAGKVVAVWAVNDGEKVERQDLAHPAKRRNSAWDGAKARMFGGRNEVLALQVVVEAGQKGIGALSISLPELSHRGGKSRIVYRPKGADPTSYVGRPIELFSEHYMRVEKPTKAHWLTVAGQPSAPADMTGDKPVQLVPENARPGRGGFPLEVPARTNQAFWIDVYVGKDLPAGHYDGTIRITADGEIHTIPLDLEVLDFTLPDEAPTLFMVYYEDTQIERYHGRNLAAEYHRLAHRHRVEFVRAYDIPAMRTHAGRFTGTDFTAVRGYEGPGMGVGNRMAPRTFYGPGELFDDPASARAEANAWMRFLSTTAPRVRTLLYMPDEPAPEEYDRILTIAESIQCHSGTGRSLPIFVTHGYTPELEPAVDIWAVLASQYDAKRATSERAAGREMIYYNGERPYVGANLIDTPATDPRVHGWATFARDIPVYFYWHANHWRHNRQAPEGYDRDQNVWANPRTFINRDGEYGNGDGVLVYPGEEKIHPDEDRGIAGPISTIQLGNLRRGVQDQIYLSMARACGREGVAQEALRAVTPAVLDQAGERPGFAEHADTFEGARRRLAEAIASCHRGK